MKGTEEVKFFQYYPLFSASFQSLSVTPSDRQRLIPGSPAPQTMIEQNIPSSTHLSAFRRRDVNSPKISISPVEDEENEYEFDKVVEVRGVGVAVSHPVHELGRRSRKLTGPPMMMPQKQKSARSTSLLWLLYFLFSWGWVGFGGLPRCSSEEPLFALKGHFQKNLSDAEDETQFPIQFFSWMKKELQISERVLLQLGY